MSKTSPLFAWRDRDTAARLMFQLSQIAPPYVRRRAVEILPAFKSSVLIDEMVEIIVNEDRDLLERRAALETLTAVPSGDLYFPQFASFVLDGWNDLTPSDFLRFSVAHPRNIDWVFDIAQTLWNRDSYLQWLSDTVHWWRDHPTMLKRVEPDIEAVLHDYPYIKKVMDDLPDRRVRRSSLWNRPKSEEEVKEKFSEHPILIELYQYYLAALKGDEEAFYKLSGVANRNHTSLSQAAAATHLLGRLSHQYDVIESLEELLRYAPSSDDYMDEYNAGVNFFQGYISLEAGYGLCGIVKPQVWETLVDIFFTGKQEEIDSFMLKWIGELTDALSGQPIE